MTEERQGPLADWERVIGVNLTGQFLCAREAAREFLRRRKTPASKALGKILCVSSVHDVIPWAGHAMTLFLEFRFVG